MKTKKFWYVLVTVLFALALIAGCEGPMGPMGPKGDDGVNGTDGTNGTNGTNGNNGIDGTNGIDGINGTNGTDGKDAPIIMSLKLGDLNVFLEDRAWLELSRRVWFQDFLNEFRNSTNGADTAALEMLNIRNVSLSIIIENRSTNYDGAEFNVINGSTFTMRFEFVSTATQSQIYMATRNALRELPSHPLP